MELHKVDEGAVELLSAARALEKWYPTVDRLYSQIRELPVDFKALECSPQINEVFEKSCPKETKMLTIALLHKALEEKKKFAYVFTQIEKLEMLVGSMHNKINNVEKILEIQGAQIAKLMFQFEEYSPSTKKNRSELNLSEQ